jgi:hypothetical protein
VVRKPWYNTPISADDPKLVWVPIWAPQPSVANRGATDLIFQDDGNLLIWAIPPPPAQPTLLWQTFTNGKNQAFLRMQDDGNLVIYQQGGAAVWASNTSVGEAPGANAS